MSTGTQPEESLLTLVNMLTSVNSTCERNITKTRVVGFRLSRLAWLLYNEVLGDVEKDTLKSINEAIIYALAKQKLGRLPCDEYVSKRVDYIVSKIGPKSLNVNININSARAESKVNVNISERDISDIVQLLEYLYDLSKENLEFRTRKILEARIKRAKNLLYRLLEPSN